MKPCKITVDLYNTFRERMPEYVQYDRNVPLEITVLENGKPADLNGLFGRLLVSKPDGHEVYSNDVEISGNVITTILGEQVFTASGVAQVTVDILDEQNSKRALIPFGMRIRSAVITDESIKSSNDYQTITALISDVRALDAMFHVEQEQRAEAFNVQMQSQEATFTEAQRQFLADHREAMFHVEQQMTEQADMFHVEQTERAKAFEQSEADREQRFETQTTEWAQTVEQAEATRQFNEERRQSAESKRESAEKARESAERQRVDTEAVRQRQEQERGQGEAGRATAEANRVKAEQTRVDNESSRKSAESSRVNAESQRATAESHRVTAETSRANAESQRATAETNRAGAEGRRSEAESNRVTAENNRATAESNRATAESARETQENARREAEEDRATRMAQWEAKAEETAQKAQEAVDSAQAFINTNEERLLTDRDKIDYWGNHHANMKDMTDATVDKILGDFNTLNHTGEYITATETIARHVPRGTLKGHTEVNCIQEPSGTDIVLPYDFEPGYDVMINDTKETGAVGIELQGRTLNYMLPYKSFMCSNPQGYGTLESNLVRVDYDDYVHYSLTLNPNSGRTLSFNHAPNGVATFYAGKTYTLYIPFVPQPMAVATRLLVRDNNHAHNYTPVKQNKDYFVFTALEDFSYLGLYQYFDFDPSMLGKTVECNVSRHAIVIEGDYYNQPLPLLEQGLNSVKAPTVTITGKNLYNGTNMTAWQRNDITGVVKPNKTYIVSADVEAETEGRLRIDVKNSDDSVKYYTTPHVLGTTKRVSVTFTVPIDAKEVFIVAQNFDSVSVVNCSNIQIEEGSVATAYEPFRSSSLTLPEEIVLRSLPNGVCDTYNVQTGKYVQRIGEITLDGNTRHTFNSNNSDNVNIFYFDNIVPNKKFTGYAQENQRLIQCDSLKTGLNFNRWDSTESEYSLANSSTGFWIFVPKSIPQSWLAQNPVAVQYELETPIVTKVPLSQVLKSWNTLTRINTSIPENSLKPIIAPVNPSYEVMLKPSTQYSIITNPIANGHASTPIEFNLGGATAETVVGNGCTLITTPSTLTNNKLEMSGRGQKLQGGVMVLEGNKTGMMFNHFDGMKSVENPTVYISNQNLFDWTTISTLRNGNQYTSNFQKPAKIRPFFVKKGEKYVVICKGSVNDGQYSAMYLGGDDLKYNNDPNNASKALIIQSPGGVTLKDGVERKFLVTAFKDCLITSIMIHGSGMTSIYTIDYIGVFKADNTQNVTYIPHQSNSLPLTIPMRSLPNRICDTLNLLTGEYVQNIYEYMFTGDEQFTTDGASDDKGYIYVKPGQFPNTIMKQSSYITCNQFPYNASYAQNKHLGVSSTSVLIFTLPETFGFTTLAQRKDYIINLAKTTDLVIQFELKEPIVTKLDLQWEDGKLFAYDGTTHFFVDVEGGQLIPILDIDVPVNLAQRTSRLCAEKEQLEAEKAQLANEVSVLQLRNAMLQGEVATLEQSNKDLQKEQEKLDKDNQELAHAVTIVDEHREEGDLELLSSDFDFELRLMEIEFAVGVPMTANYKGVRNMARTPYDMAKALILGGKYEREEMTIKLDRFEKLGSITAEQKAELIALMDAVELTQ